MSGFSLNHHWLTNTQRGEIYYACIQFTNTYLDYLDNKNYDVSVDAICWMQGELDTTEEKASRYYDNQKAFVSYLLEDLSSYQNCKGIFLLIQVFLLVHILCQVMKKLMKRKLNFLKIHH